MDRDVDRDSPALNAGTERLWVRIARGLLVGLPLAYWVTQWTVAFLIGDLMYYRIGVAPIVYVLTGLVALASTAIAAWISSRHITKTKLVDAIRQRASD